MKSKTFGSLMSAPTRSEFAREDFANAAGCARDEGGVHL
jgi:hypothetical protein